MAKPTAHNQGLDGLVDTSRHRNQGGGLSEIPVDVRRDDEGHQEDVKIAKLLANDQSDMPKGYFTSFRYLGVMFSMSLTVTSAYFGFAVPASVLTFINQDIGPSDSASLFSIVWAMVNAISLLIVGRISDKFGRRYFQLGAGALAVIGGIVAATANNMDTLIGANCIIGMATGVHSSEALFTGELIPHQLKFFFQVVILVPQVLSTGLGAYIGRALVETRSWRWIYYIYIILAGVGWVIQIFLYHPPSFHQLHGKKRSTLQEFKRIDHFGVLLLVAGLTLFLLGISWGGNPRPWTSALILSLIIVGGVTLIAFVFWEAFTPSPNPMVDLRVFRNRGFVCLNIVSMAAGAMYIALSIIWPQQVYAIYSSQGEGWKTDAWMSTTIGWGIWGGITVLFPFVKIIKHIRRQITVLLAMSVAFTAALSQSTPGNRVMAIATSFLTAFPIGWLETGTVLIVQLDAPDEDVGMVFAILSCLRSISGAVFTSVFVAILNAKVREKIPAYVTSAAVEADLPASSLLALFQAIQSQSPTALAQVPGMTPDILVQVSTALRNAYSDSYAYVYYAALAVGGTALIASFWLTDYDRFMTGHTPKPLNTSNTKSVLARADLDTDFSVVPEKADEVTGSSNHKEV